MNDSLGSRPPPPADSSEQAVLGTGAKPAPLILPAGRPENILIAARILRDGGLVVLPTDTLYGLGASVFRPEAIERVFVAKRRPAEMRVPVLLSSAADLPVLVQRVPRAAWMLIDAFWPGPLTLVLPAARAVPAQITRGGGTVAVRVPGATSCLEVLQVLGEPVVGTSANISGRPPAITAEEAAAQLGGEVDAILVDDGAIRAAQPSTVVQILDGKPVVQRLGAVSLEAIHRALGVAVRVHEQLTDRPAER